MKHRKFIWTEHELLAEYLFPREGRRWLMQKLGDDLSGTKADLCDMDHGRLQLSIPKSWKNEGLFGEVKKGDPPLFKQVGRGRTEGGSDILYSRSALNRLHYIAVGAQAGLGVKKIKAALTFGISINDLCICTDLQSWRYALTKPLTMLLNDDLGLERDGGAKAYDRIWHCTEKFEDAMARVRSQFPTASAMELDDHFERSRKARDAFPLAVLLTPPGGEDSPNLELYFGGLKDAEDVVTAIERIVRNPPGEAADWLLVQAHANDEYGVPVQASGGENPVHKGTVGEPTPIRPMPLLEQAASHLVAIKGEIRKWIGVCDRYAPEGGRCGKFFALVNSKQKTCGTTSCRNQNSATPLDAKP